MTRGRKCPIFIANKTQKERAARALPFLGIADTVETRLRGFISNSRIDAAKSFENLAGNTYCRTDGVYELARPAYNPENG